MRQALETKFGIFSGRDALFLKNTFFDPRGMVFKLHLLVDAESCSPESERESDSILNADFRNVSKISIFRLDAYPNEMEMLSSFDVIDSEDPSRRYYVVGTYDHVFEVWGDLSISYDCERVD